jgi:hypothetical protein
MKMGVFAHYGSNIHTPEAPPLRQMYIVETSELATSQISRLMHIPSGVGGKAVVVFVTPRILNEHCRERCFSPPNTQTTFPTYRADRVVRVSGRTASSGLMHRSKGCERAQLLLRRIGLACSSLVL